MHHPPTAQLLDDDDRLDGDVAAHLAGCADCARLRGLLPPASAAAAAGEGELAELPVVEPEHYAIQEELRDGVGGMSRTVRALDRRLGRTVAIKQPRTGLPGELDQLLRARF